MDVSNIGPLMRRKQETVLTQWTSLFASLNMELRLSPHWRFIGRSGEKGRKQSRGDKLANLESGDGDNCERLVSICDIWQGFLTFTGNGWSLSKGLLIPVLVLYWQQSRQSHSISVTTRIDFSLHLVAIISALFSRDWPQIKSSPLGRSQSTAATTPHPTKELLRFRSG